ncbi:MGMT family protein [Amphritea japonica]|uniref:Methylated-DNA-protein-cysteine methyltransferase n=1 Tax=Amphritea japonica ATCC BAA-1530 TaxID=1278309 RepID=A0A7R6PGE4_9GAMM|nr:MGMT family protein [Amphritea japonica]BBB25992.1 methylated-DNA-protein-cysteine methyltransferase [Amphritea japonica ATCC BAA-1530]
MAQNPAYEMIWQVVGAIPSGKVATYGQVAELAGIPGAARMVGRCLSQLPGDSQLPWFRVINASGKISLPVDSEGYQKQRALLQEEGVVVLNGRISLAKFRW